MKSIEEVRLKNLEAAIQIAGSAEALAALSGISAVYISQVRSRALHRTTGNVRNLGRKAARKIEDGLNLANGWMDSPHGSGVEFEKTSATPWPFPSIDPRAFFLLTETQRRAIEEWVSHQVGAYLAPYPAYNNFEKIETVVTRIPKDTAPPHNENPSKKINIK